LTYRHTETATRRVSLRVLTIAMLLAGALFAPAAHAQSTPGDGPGGPILVVTDPADLFGGYYAEILRAEGLNEFAVADKGTLSASLLSGYDAVLLAQTTLSQAQVDVLTTWVNNGGNLVAMRPASNLAGLLGLGADAGDLSNAYVKVAAGAPPGAGITSESVQFHGTADRRAAAGATTVATLYSAADAPTSDAAVTLRSVGPAGGQAAAFTYDLARSVVQTRQGNPAWAGQERDDRTDVIRSDDLFFPDWVDFDKIRIPQADEQQRLLANLITQMSLDRMPLPRFWYLPRGEKAAVVMTGDDHGVGGTLGQFNRFEAESPGGCSVADWECIRSTSYVFTGTSISDEDAASYQAAGFEIGLHLSTACADFTTASLEENWATQLPEFRAMWPSLAPQRTNRTHCIVWSDWAGEPKAELRHGVRFDANYYYWPEEWVQDRPGVFTGSGFPMRFADTDGTLIDVYQAVTQLTDESGINVPTHIAALLDDALGPKGYYGVFTANMHTDRSDHDGANAIVAAAKARGVPVVSAVQMLDWLDGRNGSSFQGLSFAGGQLHFSVAPAAGSRGLQAMVPASAPTGSLLRLTRNGAVVNMTRRVVKGIDYAVFDAAGGGSFVASYGPGDNTPPDTTIGGVTVSGDSARVNFSSDDAEARFECRLDGGAFGACVSPADYVGLAAGTHTVDVRAIDLAGNVDPTPASRSFSSSGAAAPPGGGQTTQSQGQAAHGGGLATPSATSSLDRSGPRIRIVRRRVRASATGLVTLRVTCPRDEVRCRVDLRLRRGGRQLVGKTLTVAGGKTASVTLRLLRSDRLRLVRLRSLMVDARATARDAAGNRATTTTRIRLLAPLRR
jgi:hypothetical protein